MAYVTVTYYVNINNSLFINYLLRKQTCLEMCYVTG